MLARYSASHATCTLATIHAIICSYSRSPDTGPCERERERVSARSRTVSSLLRVRKKTFPKITGTNSRVETRPRHENTRGISSIIHVCTCKYARCQVETVDSLFRLFFVFTSFHWPSRSYSSSIHRCRNAPIFCGFPSNLSHAIDRQQVSMCVRNVKHVRALSNRKNGRLFDSSFCISPSPSSLSLSAVLFLESFKCNAFVR